MKPEVQKPQERLPLYLYSFISSLLVGFIFVALPPYLKAIGFSVFNYGIYGSIGTFTGILGTIVGGYLSDKWKASYVIALGELLYAIAISLLMTENFWLIYLASAFSGISGSFTYNYFSVLISRTYRQERYHYAFPYLSAVYSFGSAIGSYLGFIPRILPFSYVDSLRISMMAFAYSLIPICILFSLKASKMEKISKEPEGEKVPLRKVLMGDALKFGIYNMILGFGASFSVWNVSYYFMLKYHVGSANLGIFYGSESVAMGLLMLLMPKLSERMGGSLRVYVTLSYISIPLLILITFVNNYYLAVAILIARYVLMNVANPLLNAFIMSVIPNEVRGRAFSLLSVMFSVGGVPGQSLGGYVMRENLELPFRVTAGIYLFGTSLLYYWYLRRGRK